MSASKVLKPVAGLCALVACYAAVGYLGVPAGVRWAVGSLLPEHLGGRSATIGEVSFDPWRWKLDVHDLAVKSAHAPEHHLLTLKTLSLDVSADSLLEMAPVVESIVVDGLAVQLTANEANNEQVRESVSKGDSKTSASSSGLPAFSLANVRVSNSSIHLSNPQNGADVKITEIDFALPLLSTLPSSAKADVSPKLSLKIDGNPIRAQGTLKGQTASMNIKIDNLNLAKILKAAPISLPMHVDKAAASCDLSLSFSMPDSGVSALKVSGTAALSDLDVRDLQNKPFAALKSATVTVNNVDLSTQTADIASIRVVNPVVRLAIASQVDGSKNKTADAASSSQTGSTETSSWNWSIGALDLSNGAVHVTDTSLKPAATLSATSVNVSAKKLSSAKGAVASYSAEAALAQGKLSSSGTLVLTPLAVNATTQVKALRFSTFNPWVKALAGAQLTKGTADVNGKLNLNTGKKLSVKWNGDLAVADLQAKSAAGKTLMTWTQAKAEGVALNGIAPVDIAVRKLTVKEPAKNVTQNVSKAAGLFGALAALSGHNKTAERAQKAAQTVSSDISISNIVYKDGKFSLTEKNKEALSALLVDSLNSVFSTGSGRH